ATCNRTMLTPEAISIWLAEEFPLMLEVTKYSAFATLRDGRRVEIRVLRPDDRAELVAAVARVSSQSLYRRFFEVRPSFTESEIDSFVRIPGQQEARATSRARVAAALVTPRLSLFGIITDPAAARAWRQATWCARRALQETG